MTNYQPLRNATTTILITTVILAFLHTQAQPLPTTIWATYITLATALLATASARTIHTRRYTTGAHT